MQKKINQLTKEHKDKISTLTQQIRSRSNENKELKERLTIQKNLEVKEKAHINEMFKKSFDRKPSTPQDQKIGAVISHYENELVKKTETIKRLEK